ncbi:MAG: hypothetical protein WCK41_06770 [Actinomycetes bacterium]
MLPATRGNSVIRRVKRASTSVGWRGRVGLRRARYRLGLARRQQQIVEAFAFAVVEPGTRLGVALSPRNLATDWAEITTLVRTGQSFVVRYAASFLVFDADKPTAPEAAHELRRRAEALGYSTMIWATGKQDHRQIIINMPNPNDQRVFTELAQTLEMQCRTWSRAPLSPHRVGHPVSLVYPARYAEALNGLRAGAGDGWSG